MNFGPSIPLSLLHLESSVVNALSRNTNSSQSWLDVCLQAGFDIFCRHVTIFDPASDAENNSLGSEIFNA